MNKKDFYKEWAVYSLKNTCICFLILGAMIGAAVLGYNLLEFLFDSPIYFIHISILAIIMIGIYTAYDDAKSKAIYSYNKKYRKHSNKTKKKNGRPRTNT